MERLWRSIVILLLAKSAILASIDAALAQGTSSGAAYRTFHLGSFCLIEVPSRAMRLVETSGPPSARVFRHEVAFDGPAKGEKRPRVRFFEKPPVLPTETTSCAEVKDAAIFEGNVRSLKLELVESGSEIRIKPDTLKAEIQVAASHLAPLYGGKISLGADGAIAASNRAWIEGNDDILYKKGQEARGWISLNTWGRNLRQARLEGFGDPIAVDLSAGNSNVLLKIPLNGDRLSLIEGKLGGEISVSNRTITTPGVTLGGAQIASKVALVASGGSAKVVFTNPSLAFGSGELHARRSTITTAAGKGGAREMVSALSPDTRAITPLGLGIEGFTATAPSCAMGIDKKTLMDVSGCSFVASSSAERTAIDLRAPSAANRALGLPHMPPDVRDLALVAFDSKDAATLKGSFIPGAAIQVGALTLLTGAPLSFQLQPTALDTIRLPIDISLSPAHGKWSLESPAGTVMLAGTLAKLKLKGVLSADAGNLQAWSFDSGRGDIAFDGSIAGAYGGTLYGAKPLFAQAGIAFHSLTDVHVDPAKVDGELAARVQALALLDPKFSLGKTPGGFVIKAPATFDGAVTMAFSLRDGTADVHEGRLLIAKARMETEPGKPAAIGETKLTDGYVAFDNFAATYAAGRGRLEMTGIALAGARLESLPKEEAGSADEQIQWAGVPTDTVRIAKLEGAIERNAASKRFSLEKTVLSDFAIALKDAEYGRGDALLVRVQSLELKGSTWSEDLVRASFRMKDGSFASKSRDWVGQLRVRTMELDVTGGSAKEPDGRGNVLIASGNVQAPTPVEIKESCQHKPDFQKVNARTSVAIGDTAIPLEIKAGRISGKVLNLGSAALLESTDDKYECTLPVVDWLLAEAQKAYYHYPCPTWREPLRMCPGWTYISPEIRITVDRILKIRSLKVGGAYLATRLEIDTPADRKTDVRFCGAIGIAAVEFDGGYTIVPRTSIPILNDMIERIERAVTQPVQSILGSALGTTGATLASLFGGSPQCSA